MEEEYMALNVTIPVNQRGVVKKVKLSSACKTLVTLLPLMSCGELMVRQLGNLFCYR